MKINKAHTFAVSYHLPSLYDREDYKLALEDIERQIRMCIYWDFTDYIVGMQRDNDMLIALAVSEVIKKLKKEKDIPIRLFVAWPWKKIETYWDKERVDIYKKINRRADEVFYVSKEQGRAASWMIDNASGLISDGYYEEEYGVIREAFEYAWSKIQNHEDYYINFPD